MLHTKWNGQDFLFAMNGQTGKMVGDLPTSKGKVLGIVCSYRSTDDGCADDHFDAVVRGRKR